MCSDCGACGLKKHGLTRSVWLYMPPGHLLVCWPQWTEVDLRVYMNSYHAWGKSGLYQEGHQKKALFARECIFTWEKLLPPVYPGVNPCSLNNMEPVSGSLPSQLKSVFVIG